MTSLDDCFRDGLLRKTSPDMNKARASLKLADSNAEDSKIHLGNRLYKWALIAAYASMFHSARALLFKDGIKERSHFCLCAYVSETYRGRIEAKYLNELNILREQRHRIFYGDEEVAEKSVEEAEAESAVSIARGFLGEVKKIVRE
jgi:uncharacterized protein (UPF0332 family)